MSRELSWIRECATCLMGHFERTCLFHHRTTKLTFWGLGVCKTSRENKIYLLANILSLLLLFTLLPLSPSFLPVLISVIRRAPVKTAYRKKRRSGALGNVFCPNLCPLFPLHHYQTRHSCLGLNWADRLHKARWHRDGERTELVSIRKATRKDWKLIN